MPKHKLASGIIMALSIAFIGSVLTYIFSRFIDFSSVPSAEPAIPVFRPGPTTSTASTAATVTTTTAWARTAEPMVVYAPPKPQDAPESIRDAVMLGYNIVVNTQKYAKKYVGNKLNCANCHFQGGRTRGGKNGGLSLVGVAATYPKYRKRHQYPADLVERTSGCFKRSQNGTPPPPDSKEMVSLITYYNWISKDLPIYAEIPWLGVKELNSRHKQDISKGKTIMEQVCARCHGDSGQGTLIAPPLWGPGSFNDGAGMSRVSTMASFVYLNMPKGNPHLSEVQAIDVSGYVTKQPRPHYANDGKY